MNKRIRFKIEGWDWSELAKYFDVSSNEKEEPDILKATQEAILKADDLDIYICRKFLKKLICGLKKYKMYDYELYIGLSKIKEDKTFLEYFSVLLSRMWY